jgi:hypothetical protein
VTNRRWAVKYTMGVVAVVLRGQVEMVVGAVNHGVLALQL